jgi:hypothetical protein
MGLQLMLWVRLMFKGKSSASIPDCMSCTHLMSVFITSSLAFYTQQLLLVGQRSTSHKRYLSIRQTQSFPW